MEKDKKYGWINDAFNKISSEWFTKSVEVDGIVIPGRDKMISGIIRLLGNIFYSLGEERANKLMERVIKIDDIDILLTTLYGAGYVDAQHDIKERS